MKKFLHSPVKLGTKDISIKVGGFTVTETIRSPGFVIPPHYHEHTNISFALAGGPFIETIGRKPFEIRPGSVVVRPAGETHENQYGSEHARSLIIEIGARRAEMIREKNDALERVAHFRDGVMWNLALRIHKEFRQRDEASLLCAEGLVLEILAQTLRHNPRSVPKKEPRWLREARDFLRAEFSRPVSMSEIARIAGVHPSHLAKSFRLHHRCTPGEYVRRLRLEHAEKELKGSDKSLIEIALAAGFYDQSHFTNAFKLQYGVTPSEFRKLACAGKNFNE